MSHILLIEDDSCLRENISGLLTFEGFTVEPCPDIASGEMAFRTALPSLLILDVLLPDGSGFDFCRRVRASYPSLPILFLTCCAEEEDTVRGFSCGADDYVEKPFRAKVLVSRIRALLRRTSADDSVLSAGVFLFDRKKQVCRINGIDLGLTPSEYRILSELAESAGQTVPRESLLHALWELNYEYVDENTLFVHMSRLRARLGSHSHRLRTLRGEGYRLEVGE